MKAMGSGLRPDQDLTPKVCAVRGWQRSNVLPPPDHFIGMSRHLAPRFIVSSRLLQILTQLSIAQLFLNCAI
jgi:hypothetical protein